MSEQAVRKSPGKSSFLSYLIVFVIGCALVIWGWTFDHVTSPSWWFLNARTLENFWFNVGDVGVIFGIGAVLFWTLRKSFVQFKSLQLTQYRPLLVVFHFLKAHHVFLGWLAFAAALGHALYFMFFAQSDKAFSVYTGLIAILAMFFVVGMGIMFRFKTVDVKKAKRWHFLAAAVFVVGLAIHLI